MLVVQHLWDEGKEAREPDQGVHYLVVHAVLQEIELTQAHVFQSCHSAPQCVMLCVVRLKHQVPSQRPRGKMDTASCNNTHHHHFCTLSCSCNTNEHYTSHKTSRNSIPQWVPWLYTIQLSGDHGRGSHPHPVTGSSPTAVLSSAATHMHVSYGTVPRYDQLHAGCLRPMDPESALTKVLLHTSGSSLPTLCWLSQGEHVLTQKRPRPQKKTKLIKQEQMRHCALLLAEGTVA